MEEKVNKHNAKIRRTENSCETRKVAGDSAKVTVWCAMFVNQEFSLHYSHSPIVTAESYRQLFTNSFLPMLPSLSPDASFQQDCGPKHYSLEVRQPLDEKLSDFLDEREGLIRQPARSPHLTSLELFL